MKMGFFSVQKDVITCYRQFQIIYKMSFLPLKLRSLYIMHILIKYHLTLSRFFHSD